MLVICKIRQFYSQPFIVSNDVLLDYHFCKWCDKFGSLIGLQYIVRDEKK